MSHRIKRLAAFAIFALFYHFAAVDSIFGHGGHQIGSTQRQNQVYQMSWNFGVHHRRPESKSFAFDRGRWTLKLCFI